MYAGCGVKSMILVPLLQNMALIVTMLLIYQFLERRFTRNTVWVRLLSGILFGMAGVIGMLTPLKISTGLIYDGRSIILAISGIFAGPVSAIMAGFMCMAYRLWLGGQGAVAGTMVILESVALGSFYGYLTRTKKIKMNLVSLSILGIAVHMLMLAMQMFIPNRGWVEVIPRIAPVVLLAYPLIFLLVCRIFIDADNRKSEHEALLESEARYRGMFENNRAVMLLIDPSNGRIIDANSSATAFYGWSRDELLSMRIGQINLLGDEATQVLRDKALMTQQNQFLLQHRTKTNGIRDVDVYSGPIPFGTRTLLHSIIHDVTNSEEALRERAMLFEAIDRSFNEVFIFDAETLRYSYANRGALENLGYTMEVLRTLTPMDLKTELHEPELRSILNELLSGKKSITVLQTAMQRADGSTYPVELRLQLHDSGKQRVFLEIAMDITERKQTEDAIRLDEARLESLFRINQHPADNIQELLKFSLEEAISLTRSEIGYIYFYDEEKEEFTLNTWSKEVMTQCSVIGQQPISRLEDTGIWGEAVRQRQPIIVNDFSQPNPYKKGMPGGHAPLSKFMTIPVFADERIVAVAGVANKQENYNDSDVRQLRLMMDAVWKIAQRKDVERELKQRESHLNKIFDVLPLGLWLTDRNGKTLRGNPAGAKIWDASPNVPIEDYGVFKARHLPSGREILPGDDALTHSIREGITVTNEMLEIMTFDGHRKVILNYTAPVLDDDGQLLGAIIVNNDITELQKAEEEIRLLNTDLEHRVTDRTAQLKEANNELESFSYSVSHDLRTPLRAIDGYVRILLEDFSSSLGDEGKRVCTVISTNAQKMGKLIDDLLSFSRTGKVSINLSTIDMNAMVAMVFNEIVPETARERIDFRPGDLSSALGDPVLIRQVWANLISNAVKFSSKKERADIIIDSESQENEMVYSIADNGAGFNMEYANKLFGVFQRLHSQSEFDGTGVGLAIVQRIIQRHGGKIWAKSELGKGATFYFSLKAGKSR